VEAVVMTVSRRQLAREALAEVLYALEPQKAHWYQLKAPIANEACNDRFQALFPYLGTLLSLSAEFMHFVLETSGLIRWLDKKKGVTCITLVSWDHFKHEFKLHVEFTTFQFGNKRNPFIRVGSWDCYHPPVTPNDIWSMKKVQYRVPMLRIATISMRFASKVGKFYTNDVEVVKEETSEDEININDASHKEGEDVNEEVEKKASLPSDLFQYMELSEQDFPLLHSLGINRESQINGLIQEIVKLRSEGGMIKYTQKNNRMGFLLPAPSLRCTGRYKAEFSKGSQFVAAAVELISDSAKCTEAEAAECMLEALFKSYEESFMAVAKSNGICVPVGKKMDAVAVEAMLAECRLGKDASRALFRHLRQFLGKSYFESEHKRREAFSGKDFPPTVKTIELPDKTLVEFWYKLPHLLIQHQINTMINYLGLDGITRLDICVGGDHGGGKFRMSLKLLFRFNGRESISRLYQIASVSHPQDNSQLLKDTVLEPIGESLKLIVDGGRFIVKKDNTSNTLECYFDSTVNIISVYCFKIMYYVI